MKDYEKCFLVGARSKEDLGDYWEFVCRVHNYSTGIHRLSFARLLYKIHTVFRHKIHRDNWRKKWR